MSRSIQTLAAIIGTIAACVSALVGLIQLGVIEAPRDDRSARAVDRPAAHVSPSRTVETLERIRSDEDGAFVLRTRVTNSSPEGASALPTDLSQNLKNLLEVMESTSSLSERLFRDEGNLDNERDR